MQRQARGDLYHLTGSVCKLDSSPSLLAQVATLGQWHLRLDHPSFSTISYVVIL